MEYLIADLLVIYAAGVFVTFAMCFWAAWLSPRFSIPPSRAFVAALVWPATLLLAVTVIRRTRVLIPFARKFLNDGVVSVDLKVKIAEPAESLISDMRALLRNLRAMPPYHPNCRCVVAK